ncbi:uncharacterized protein LOC133135415 [Conger conger]|uniref:uncharacterized protein LOC133135415 n=1 Tax=Conger conger TaxID=82655 RepID=UPI002A5AAD79|nr:uncharacterized protein LOC133135415 [Conger conger]
MQDAQQQEQNFIRAVIPQLKNGIEHFKTVATILLAYDESKTLALQHAIVQAKWSLEWAESAASSQLSQVDALTESLTARKGELDREQINKVKELENLETESQCIADCMETFRKSLDDARRARDSARGILEDLERKQRVTEAVRDVAIGIMFIPIIGTIPGAIIALVSQVELDNAKSAIRTAEEEVENSEREVNNYYYKLEQKKRQCTKKKDEIAQCSRTIEQIKQSLAQVYTQRTNIARAQEKLRNALYMLSTLAGRASVATTLTQRTNINPMQEILWSGANMLNTLAARVSVATTHTQRTNINPMQEIFWSGANMLSTLAARASVATTYTPQVICLPPVVNILGEIIELMLQMQGDRRYELLSDPQVKAAILSLQELHQKVSAIDDEQTLNEIQFY